MSPPMAFSWEAGEEPVVGQWCSLGMYGALDAEFEVQRTIKRAEFDGFPLSLQKGCRSYHDSCG